VKGPFTRRLRLLVLALLIVAAGCSASSADAATVSATLTDGSITLDRETVPSGPVSISVSNDGTELHELEVFRGDDVDLPVSNGVAVTTGLRLIDEIEDVVPGTTTTLHLDLEPGTYVIICNLPGHYELGMVVQLDVTG
jgi:Cupredoxin-like domain